jgi:threonine/homoserine/homoserine lactone efflux protein
MNFWIPLLSAVSLGFAAAVQPGPLSMYLISQTLRTGWKKTMPAIFSPLISDGPIAVVCLFVITRFPSVFLQYLQVAGGIFILYLSWQAIRAWKNFQNSSGDVVDSSGSHVRTVVIKAAVVNFLNPGPYLGWSMVIGPLFLKSWNSSPALGISMITCFYLTLFSTMAAIILVFHLAREQGPRLQRALIGISGVLLGIFGAYMMGSAAADLVKGI